MLNISESSFSGIDPAKIYVPCFSASLEMALSVGLSFSSSAYSTNLSLEYGQLNISGRTIKLEFKLAASFIIEVAFSMFFCLLSTTFI